MSEKKYTADDCVALLKEKHSALLASGLSRYPCRSDFDEREVVAIKAFLGPWPRALEAAGIKPPRDDAQRKERIKQKRIEAKRLKTALKRSLD